jgi:hypothetical protein
MFDLFFVGFLFILSLFCAFEIIIFNEEILLLICFFSFIFVCFNSFSESVFDMFADRASKFEIDLLDSFIVQWAQLNSDFIY